MSEINRVGEASEVQSSPSREASSGPSPEVQDQRYSELESDSPSGINSNNVGAENLSKKEDSDTSENGDRSERDKPLGEDEAGKEKIEDNLSAEQPSAEEANSNEEPSLTQNQSDGEPSTENASLTPPSRDVPHGYDDTQSASHDQDDVRNKPLDAEDESKESEDPDRYDQDDVRNKPLDAEDDSKESEDPDRHDQDDVKNKPLDSVNDPHEKDNLDENPDKAPEKRNKTENDADTGDLSRYNKEGARYSPLTDSDQETSPVRRKLTPEEVDNLKQRINDDRAQREAHPSGFNNLGKGNDASFAEKAKFTGKNFDALAASMGDRAYKEAYDKALKENKSEDKARAEAQDARNAAERSIAEKKNSSAKYCDEDRFLNHANARGQNAKDEAKAAGKSDRQCEKAYNDAFRDTYANDYGKRAYDAEMKNSGNKEAAEKAKKDAMSQAYKDTHGNRINRIKPDSSYYKRYEDLRKSDDVKAGHPSAFHDKPLYVNYSKDGSASGKYATHDKNASPRDTIRGNSLPEFNTADKRDEVKLNDKTSPETGSKNVYAIESKSAPMLAEQRDKNSVFHGGKDKLIGGGNQITTTGDGFRDGSVTRLDNRDTPENIRAKEDYLKDLSDRCPCKDNLKNADIPAKWERVDGDELDAARKSFERDKDRLIKDWEANNGMEWPTYKEDVYNNDGKIVRHAGDRYDAHHIQPLSLGGMNTSENLVPLHYKDHIGKDGIHNIGSYDTLFDKYNAKKD